MRRIHLEGRYLPCEKCPLRVLLAMDWIKPTESPGSFGQHGSVCSAGSAWPSALDGAVPQFDLAESCVLLCKGIQFLPLL